MNEYRYALEIIKNGIVGDKPSETLSILARYYRHKENKGNTEIYNLLNNHMSTYYPNYNPVKWSITLDNQVKKSKKYPLIEIDYVSISANELETISKIRNIRLERLTFTLLCCAKFGNLRNNLNNNWVNREYKELFCLARVVVTSRKQCEMLHELKKMGLITTSKKIDNINISVNFVDEQSNVVLNIDDFRELGYEYMLYHGGKYIRCVECDKLIKPRTNNSKYCKDCASYSLIERKTKVCADCKTEFEVDGIVKNKTRCENCQKIKVREYEKIKKQKQRKSCVPMF